MFEIFEILECVKAIGFFINSCGDCITYMGYQENTIVIDDDSLKCSDSPDYQKMNDI